MAYGNEDGNVTEMRTEENDWEKRPRARKWDNESKTEKLYRLLKLEMEGSNDDGHIEWVMIFIIVNLDSPNNYNILYIWLGKLSGGTRFH